MSPCKGWAQCHRECATHLFSLFWLVADADFCLILGMLCMYAPDQVHVSGVVTSTSGAVLAAGHVQQGVIVFREAGCSSGGLHPKGASASVRMRLAHGCGLPATLTQDQPVSGASPAGGMLAWPGPVGSASKCGSTRSMLAGLTCLWALSCRLLPVSHSQHACMLSCQEGSRASGGAAAERLQVRCGGWVLHQYLLVASTLHRCFCSIGTHVWEAQLEFVAFLWAILDSACVSSSQSTIRIAKLAWLISTVPRHM